MGVQEPAWGVASSVRLYLLGRSEWEVALTEDQGQPVRYQSFLVRLWAEGSPLQWRASIRNIHSGEEMRFATVEHLFAYLQQYIATRQTENHR